MNRTGRVAGPLGRSIVEGPHFARSSVDSAEAFAGGEVGQHLAEPEARKHEAAYKAWNEKSEHALHPHHYLAMSMTLLQIAIALASITVLTQKRWLLVGAALGALCGAVLGVIAWL